MSDDAAQDKKTEDDSVAAAGAQGSADQVDATKTSAAAAEGGEQAAEPVAATEPAAAETAEPAADSGKAEADTEKSAAAESDADKTAATEVVSMAKTEKPAAESTAASATPAAGSTATTAAESTATPAAESTATPAAAADTAGAAKPPADEKSRTFSAVAVPMLALIAIGVVLVAAIAAAAGFWWQSHNRQNQLDDREAATTAACDFARAVSTYDDKSWNDFAPKVQALITGEFKQMFDPMAGDVKDILSQAHAKSNLNVLRCGYESGDDSKASVLVSLSQTSSNDFRAKPLVLTLPTYVELEKHDGKWLVSKFQPVYSGDDNPLIPGAAPGGSAPQAAQPSSRPSAQPTTPAQAAPSPAKPAN